VPKFNSVIDYMFRSVDYEDSVLANTGRPATAYHIGKYLAVGVGLIAFPVLTITLTLASWAMQALTGNKSLKFYYMNPKMHMYWGTVNTLVTQFVTEKGLLTPMFMDSKSKSKVANTAEIGMKGTISQYDIDELNRMLGGNVISDKTNYIDIFSIVTKAQRAAITQKMFIAEQIKNGNWDPAIQQYSTKGILSKIATKLNSILTFGDYLKTVNKAEDGAPSGDAKRKNPATLGPPLPPGAGPATKLNPDDIKRFSKTSDPKKGTPGTYSVPISPEESGIINRMEQSATAALEGGASYATFAVEYLGSTSESFSNSVSNIQLGDQIKSISHKSRQLSYSLARGNLFGNNIIQDGINAVADIAKGVLNVATLGLTDVLPALMGNAYVEVPKRWEDSSMSFQQHSYNMQLRAPYNTFLSQLQNMYIPLFMLMAGTSPLATGKNSYTSPYLCRLYCRGFANIEMGMITSLTIKRGTSNLGFDKKRGALAIDVSFTVTDFSTLITSPVNSSVFGDLFNAILEDDTPLGNYISILGSRDIITARYQARKIAMRISRRLTKFDNIFNTERIGVLEGLVLENTLGAFTVNRALSPTQVR